MVDVTFNRNKPIYTNMWIEIYFLILHYEFGNNKLFNIKIKSEMYHSEKEKK